MRVCIGGTFNPLHKGHKLLIEKAFEVAGKQGSVFIGITTGEIVKGKMDVESFEGRKKVIEKYLYVKDFIKRVTVKPIIDKYGPSIEEEFDAIVISPETRKTAEEINKKRKQNGRKPLEIIQIHFVLAEDGHPISSSRIRKHEIDKDGRLLSQD
jgi:pantetheine-phosphate adenylyltransferase